MQRNTTVLAAIHDQFSVIEEIAGSMRNLSEILVSADGSVYVEGGGRLKKTSYHIDESDRMLQMETLAGYYDLPLTASSAYLSARIPIGTTGGRFHGIIPPISTAPTYSIRFPSRTRWTLDRLVRLGGVTAREAEGLAEAVRRKQNIIIAGETSSGKTSLANALLNEISHEHVFVIEDAPEIVIANEPTTYTLTTMKHGIADLIADSLRMRPDRIIVGEIRTPHAAVGLLEAWRTGHKGGIATIHAGGVDEVWPRLLGLMRRLEVSPDERLISDALDVVVHCSRDVESDGKAHRRVREIKYLREGTNALTRGRS